MKGMFSSVYVMLKEKSSAGVVVADAAGRSISLRKWFLLCNQTSDLPQTVHVFTLCHDGSLTICCSCLITESLLKNTDSLRQLPVTCHWLCNYCQLMDTH